MKHRVIEEPCAKAPISGRGFAAIPDLIPIVGITERVCCSTVLTSD